VRTAEDAVKVHLDATYLSSSGLIWHGTVSSYGLVWTFRFCLRDLQVLKDDPVSLH
jgi:hypothetical protein